MRTFNGYERPDGTIGIRNHVVIIPSVACANGVVEGIARAVPQAVPVYHGHGCGRGGADLQAHQRTLANIAKNPNVAAVLIVGLGCEVIKAEGIALIVSLSKKPVEYFYIQNEGGSRKSVSKGIEIVNRMIEEADRQERKPFPLSSLKLGLECGGSDAFSGVTANPSVGLVADWLVNEGGTVILTETTEMIGTTTILERRAKNADVALKIRERVELAEKRTNEILGPLASYVIAPGNMDGGMSSIQEKSLGCITKAGHSTINQIINYAEPPEEKGLVIMDGPGYDAESLAGIAAAGCQAIIFTTGRGNPIGFPVVPVLKIASTSALYSRMEDDMDINAGAVLDGKSLSDVADEIKAQLLNVLEGEPTKAEVNRQGGIVCLYSTGPSF